MLKDKLNISTIDIDLYKNNIYNKEKIKSLDVNSRFKRFRFFYNGLILDLSDITVRAYMIKQDNKEVFNDLSISENIAELEFTNQTLLVPGILKLELVLYQEDAELSSFLLEYEVIKSLRSDNSIESSNEYNSLQIALQKVELWNKNYQALYDKWNTDFDNLHINKSDMLDDLKTTKENELNKLKSDKDTELTTLYNSKDEELTNLNNDWDIKFRDKYNGLNQEYSDRVTNLEDDILDPNSSEPLLNENTNSFKVGTGTVNGVAKDYTEQMEQSLVTLDNIDGYTIKDSATNLYRSINLSDISLQVNDNPIYKLSTSSSDYEQKSIDPHVTLAWKNIASIEVSTRLRIIKPIKIPIGARYIGIKSTKMEFQNNLAFLGGNNTDTSDDTLLGTYGWISSFHKTIVIKLPDGCSSIGYVARKSDNSTLKPSDIVNLDTTFEFYKDSINVSGDNLELCKVSDTVKDTLSNGIVTKKVESLLTRDNTFIFESFDIVTSSGNTYGRLRVVFPNCYSRGPQHMLCNELEVSATGSDWSQPNSNKVLCNLAPNKNVVGFTLRDITTKEAALDYILKVNPMQFIYMAGSASVIEINTSILANKNELLTISSNINLTSTHKVQLNTKSQIEDVQKNFMYEKKSLWNKINSLLDVQMNLDVNGYIKLPTLLGGLILQWGEISGKFVNNKVIPYTFNLPVSFNSRCLFSTSKVVERSDGDPVWIDVGILNQTSNLNSIRGTFYNREKDSNASIRALFFFIGR